MIVGGPYKYITLVNSDMGRIYVKMKNNEYGMRLCIQHIINKWSFIFNTTIQKL